MKPEEIGIVRLEDLPSKEVYISLRKELFDLLNNEIREYGVRRLADELVVSKRIIMHWLSDGSLIRMDIITKICDYFGINFKSDIAYLRGKDGGKIKNPKLFFDFTSYSGVRVIAAILGDGYLPKDKTNPVYSNTNIDLIEGFAEDMKSVFGDVEFNLSHTNKITSVIKRLSYPSLIYKVFLKLGLKPGKKVETNQGLPSFIFRLDDKIKFAFISQFFDDEGSISIKARSMSISAACLEEYGEPHIL